MEEDIVEQELPDLGYAEGFDYLYQLLSHLTSSKQWFGHKVSLMVRLSRETQQSHVSRADIEAMFPQYTAKELDTILNSLIEGTWLVRQEGTLQYSLSKSGLLFLRFLPFLYRGDEMDEMSFQLAVTEILKVADLMGLSLSSMELLRDQILYSVRRHISELANALVSRNDERIRKLIHKISEFVGNIDELIKRMSDITNYKISKGLELTEADKHGIEILLTFHQRVMSLYDERKQYYLDHQVLGSAPFTKSDIDRLLSGSSFYQMTAWIDKGVFTPSGSSWFDENNLIESLQLFLQQRKHSRGRRISRKVSGGEEMLENMFIESPYSEKLTTALIEEFKVKESLTLEQFLQPLSEKVEGFMYLAALCAMENQKFLWRDSPFIGYTLDTKMHSLTLQEHLFHQLSDALIERMGTHV
ncbi:hypothetical protein AK95_03255 [Paenibacillus sp. LC231]|uniref:Uncharacterized protein n=1 Tax=Paenibacillus glucanolyticus TaxID=59843 RepID=A0A163GEE9_9BACL|nr:MULTISPECIES: hypothetical protein [Paenibacillus]KZS44929.1 hypothetical protein AWU65_02790 [Paenibacillus glucanolyticus]OIB01933.1 hypothetical protein AK95_03255 [Paenibacillus sp. LC231]OMF65519.1 hypothetical protein BK142_30700 [Paenibacillus glucanolyticus]